MTIKDVEKQIEALEDYIEEIVECFTERMPKLVSEIEELVMKADTLSSNASAEFEALGVFEKAQAAAKTLKLVSDLKKIPPFMKKELEHLKQEVGHLQSLSKELENPAKLAEEGKKCADSKKFEPDDCYDFIYPHQVKK